MMRETVDSDTPASWANRFWGPWNQYSSTWSRNFCSRLTFGRGVRFRAMVAPPFGGPAECYAPEPLHPVFQIGKPLANSLSMMPGRGRQVRTVDFQTRDGIFQPKVHSLALENSLWITE